MRETQSSAVDAAASEEESAFENYLPATLTLSSEPGRVERFLKTLFRRRGRYRVVVTRKE